VALPRLDDELSQVLLSGSQRINHVPTVTPSQASAGRTRATGPACPATVR
jgi:hypothetical protein